MREWKKAQLGKKGETKVYRGENRLISWSDWSAVPRSLLLALSFASSLPRRSSSSSSSSFFLPYVYTLLERREINAALDFIRRAYTYTHTHARGRSCASKTFGGGLRQRTIFRWRRVFIFIMTDSNYQWQEGEFQSLVQMLRLSRCNGGRVSCRWRAD